MKRKLRIVRVTVLLAVVALVLSACGGGGGQTSGGGAQTGSGAQLLIWTGGGPGGEATKKLGEAWGKENGVNVAVQLVPENLQTQFVTASQAGKAPDVVMGAHDWIGNLVQNGAIDPIQTTEDTRAAYEKPYALYPHMSVADSIAYGLKIRRMDKAEIDRRVNRVAEMLELGPLLDRKPKQLSGGQRQRVMGRAIVRQPQVFLMDEPLSNLDAKLRVQMRSEIAQVQHDLDVTTIYVTHDQTEAMTMGDRVAVMKGGILQALGEPQYLYDNPANIFVAGFIGSPPMNMAVGKVIRPDNNGDLAVRLGSATLRLHPAVAQERPGLAAYVSRDVAVGIRSEDMEDARLVREAPPDSRLKATVSLVEALGAQIVVHFEIDAPKVVTADTKALEKDAHTDEAPTHAEIEGTKFVAAFAPRSRVKIGDTIEVVVDTERMHFFDPDTGEAIRG